MIIQCDKCSTKFKLDDAKVTGKGIRVRCTKCQNVFAVVPPAAAAAPVPAPAADEGVDSNVQGQDAGTGAKEGAGGDTDFTGFEAPAPPEQNLASQPSFGEQAFDFGTPPEGGFDAFEGGQSAAGGAGDWSIGGEGIGGGEGFDAGAGGEAAGGESDAFGGEGFDAGAGGEAAGGGSHAFGGEGFDAGAGGEAAGGETDAFGGEGFDVGAGGEAAGGESHAFGGDDMGAPPPQEEPFMQPPPTPPVGDDWQIGKADEGETGEETPQTGADNGASADDEGPSADSEGYDGGIPSEPKAEQPHAGMSDKEFAAALSESTDDEHKAVVAKDKGLKQAAGASSKSAKLIPLVIIVLIIIGAVAWFFGIRGGEEQVVTAPTVEIAAIEGRYAETKNLGNFFVIEAKIKNVTAVPQQVKGVVGILYDANGVKLASVPGRVISSDDINNLTREDLAKAVKPGSVGTVPSKGTLPVVVIFAETPSGMSEYGIEIIP